MSEVNCFLPYWLSKAGVDLDEDIAIDELSQLYGASPLMPIVQAFDTAHPATKDLAEQHGQAIFPNTRTLTLNKTGAGANGVVLVKTQPTAFGWVGTGSQAPSHPSAKDKRGPLDVMVAVEQPATAFGGSAAAPDKTSESWRIHADGIEGILTRFDGS